MKMNSNDERLFKTLLSFKNSIENEYSKYEELGITLPIIDITMSKIEDLVLDLMGIPEDNTSEKFKFHNDGSIEILPDCFCRDLFYNCLMEEDVDKCWLSFKEVYKDYLNELNNNEG